MEPLNQVFSGMVMISLGKSGSAASAKVLGVLFKDKTMPTMQC